MKPQVTNKFWTGYRNAVLIEVIILLAIGGCVALTGCSQRQVKYYEYDENTGIHREWCYKQNSLASKQKIDWLYLDLFGKGSLYFGPYVLDNDSFKGGYGLGWMGTSDE